MPSVQFFQTKDTQDRERKMGLHVLKGALFGLFTALILIAVCALGMLIFGTSATYAPIFSKIVFYLSAISSGIAAGVGRQRGGFVYGLLAGGLFFLLIFALRFLLIQNTALRLGTLVPFVLCMICGALGGIVGINMKVKRKKEKKH